MKSLPRIPEIVVACLLLYSGFTHAANPYLFANTIAGYEILPFWMLSLVPFVLPHLMIVLGTCLICQKFQQLAIVASATLFMIFTLAQTWAWYIGANIGCGCFGYSNEPISVRSIAVPFLCTAACAAVFFTQYAPAESAHGVAQDAS